MDFSSEPLLIAYISAGAVCLGAIIAFGGVLIARSGEDRRHYRELGVQVALAKFNQQAGLLQKKANMTGRSETMPPFNAFLIDGIRLMEIISNKRLSAEDVGRKINELIVFSEAVTATVQAENNR